MKKILYILFFFFTVQTAFAQDDQPGKLREKMVEYIQNKLGLDRAEAERFQPVFFEYLKDLRKTNQEFKGDRLVQQQKVVELRLRYRDQFKPIVGEKRSNEVFKHEREFVDKAADVLRDRRTERRTNKGKNSNLFSN
ncbi:MAG: hypothetical protein EOO10_04405 [Chitinophagaceae bacterium]|nr:MAG: hypothetical protein EOO10_04405 [Chitinophagaceae bacterium]